MPSYGTIILPPATALLPDGSSSNAAARFFYEKSSGTPPSSAPNVWQAGLKFSNATQEHAFWQFQLPQDWNGTQGSGYPLMRARGSCSATSSYVQMYTGIAVAGDSANPAATALTFINADSSSQITVPGTASQVFEVTCELTDTASAAGKLVVVYLSRVAAGAAADWLVRGVELYYLKA